MLINVWTKEKLLQIIFYVALSVVNDTPKLPRSELEMSKKDDYERYTLL